MTTPATAVFLDRDGVINQNIYYPDTGEWESPRTVADFRFHHDALRSLKTLTQAGYTLFLVSNQPSYAKGKTSLEHLHQIHLAMLSSFTRHGIRFTDCYYCYHHPDAVVPDLRRSCPCRKPGIHFLTQARADFGVDLASAWMIGDRDSDIACGQSAGTRTILVDPDHPTDRAGRSSPTYRARDLADAVRILGALPKTEHGAGARSAGGDVSARG